MRSRLFTHQVSKYTNANKKETSPPFLFDNMILASAYICLRLYLLWRGQETLLRCVCTKVN